MGLKLLRRIGYWVDFAAGILGAIAIASMTAMLLRARSTEIIAINRPLKYSLIAGGFLIAAALAVSAILRALKAIRESMEGRYLVFETPSGPVSFRAASVEQAINRTVVAMDEVSDAALELVLPKGAKVPAEARLRCRLYDRPNLLAIQDQVRAAASDRYLEMFPGQEPLAVRVTVERIVFETPGPKAVPPAEGQPASEASAESLPFRPQYPVGD
ncbi:MAG: hypothetical protein FJ291_26895 [Planctomycetes bacterium]|nr:hypothetical protein [Planctomycetota bacterium]